MSDLPVDTTHAETIDRAGHAAPKCRCADSDVVAYRDEDGDWMCYSCGRALPGRGTRRLEARPAASIPASRPTILVRPTPLARRQLAAYAL